MLSQLSRARRDTFTMLVLSDWFKIIKKYIYIFKMFERFIEKAANLHLIEAGAMKCFAFLHEKITSKRFSK